MEAVARAFATDKKVLVIRNGYFSFRWSDIFKYVDEKPKKKIRKRKRKRNSRNLNKTNIVSVCKLPSEEIVMKAGPIDNQGDSVSELMSL